MAGFNVTRFNSSLLVNQTSSEHVCYNLLNNMGLRIFLLVIYSAVVIFGLIGNALIIYIVIKNKHLRTSSTNLFIVNMAACDIGIVCFMVPKKIAEVFTGHLVWLIPGSAGLALCKIVPFLHDVFTECSTYSLVLITLDRFVAVVLPQKRWLSSRGVVFGLIVSTWIASVIVNAVVLKVFQIVHIKSNMYCTAIWKSQEELKAYMLTMIVIFILFPIIFIPIAYAAIYLKLKRQFAALSHSISDQQRLQDLVRQRKIVYMAFCIVCGFAICWSPFALQMILQYMVFLYDSTCSFFRFHQASFVFLVFIPVINPVICLTFSSAFKDELKKIYGGICKCGRRVGKAEIAIASFELSRN